MQHSQRLDYLDQAAIRSGAPRGGMTVRAGTRGSAGIHPALLAIMGLGEAHAEGYNPPQRAIIPHKGLRGLLIICQMQGCFDGAPAW